VEEWLAYLTRNATTVIDLMALVIICLGTIEAFIYTLRFLFVAGNGHELRTHWLRYARWLVAGLTFQLAADILETAIAPSWDDVGKLAAIAVVRTFLNFFLERDVTEVRDVDSGAKAA
jgi:uncharacterized membrane protein